MLQRDARAAQDARIGAGTSPRVSKVNLADLGYDVATVRGEGLQGPEDSKVALAARSEGRILLMLDVNSGDMHQCLPGSHPGITVFLMGSRSILPVSEFVEQFFRSTDGESLRGCLVVVEPGGTRIRWPVKES